MQIPKKHTSFRLTTEILEKLEDRANELGKSKTDLLEEILAEYFGLEYVPDENEKLLFRCMDLIEELQKDMLALKKEVEVLKKKR
ncbi:MAG: ribbon-helix-helix protein, CopG family [Cyanobacteria bacterium J06635_10]